MQGMKKLTRSSGRSKWSSLINSTKNGTLLLRDEAFPRVFTVKEILAAPPPPQTLSSRDIKPAITRHGLDA
jgi:hypothetical protein